MGSAKNVGRIVGMLLLVHLAAGLTVPFVVLDRVRRPAGFLAGAAEGSVQLRAAVLLLILGSAVAVGIAIAALPVFRRHITGVTMRALLGYPPVTVLAMPLAPAYVALAVWLMAKGFDERHRPFRGQAHGPGLARSYADGRVRDSARAVATHQRRRHAGA